MRAPSPIQVWSLVCQFHYQGLPHLTRIAGQNRMGKDDRNSVMPSRVGSALRLLLPDAILFTDPSGREAIKAVDGRRASSDTPGFRVEVSRHDVSMRAFSVL
jgi:hypothetical protein